MAWITPKDPTKRAEYWLTCRSEDAAPGYAFLGMPDKRVRYMWNGCDAWITGTRWTQQGDRPVLSLLASGNGWRIEGAG